MTYKIIHSDLLEYLADNQDAAKSGDIPKYHAVLCDPPYGIDFMSKNWDKYTPKAYQAWVTEWASLLLDFVHPGGVLMAFGGTRTYHRLVCGLEDAGWEVADSLIAWTYGSGFPKSTSISKQIDKHLGAEREVVGNKRSGIGRHGRNDFDVFHGSIDESLKHIPITAPATPEAALFDGMGSALKPSYEPIVICRKPRGGLTYAECALQFGSGGLNIDKSRIGVSADDNIHAKHPHTIPSGKGNVFNFGNSSIEQYDSNKGRWPANTILIHHPDCSDDTCHPICHVRVMGEQSGESVSSNSPRNNNYPNSLFFAGNKSQALLTGHNDSGTASRFFYQAKSSNWERNAGLGDMNKKFAPTMGNGIGAREHDPDDTKAYRRNPHPTIKPIQLTQYLATLLKTPVADSRILVPFSGSGSEMIGAVLSKWSHVTGIEMTDEYIPIAEARLKWWSQFDSYEEAQAASGYEKEADAIREEKQASGQLSLFEGII